MGFNLLGVFPLCSCVLLFNVSSVEVFISGDFIFQPPSVGEVTPASPSPVNVITKNVPKLWFQNEIQSMM